MLLNLTTIHQPATDLGYLLGKNPARCQSFSLNFGQAHVFYPEARDDRCTASLLLDLDPVGLVRGWNGPVGEGGMLAQYVNERPYVASSFFSVAIAQIYRSALNGDSRERPDLAQTPIPLEAELPVLPSRGGEDFLRRLFEPLGYMVEARRLPLDERFPDWGDSPYFAVTLTATCRLRDLLAHLYVLLPVLDNDKHYWVGQDELEKLLARGEGWLAGHPEKDAIASRYLKHQRPLLREALARLVGEDDLDPEASEAARGRDEEQLEERISLNQARIGAVVAALRQAGARRVVDLGCGEGRLLGVLLKDAAFERVEGFDVSHRALEIAHDKLNLDRLPPKLRERIALHQGALTYRDARLAGFDAACAIEVIEHLDPPRLPAFERVVFEFAKPPTVIVTTPNVEYNVRFENLPAGKRRHRDHRFEWTRREFREWAEAVAERFGYRVRFLPVGAEDAEVGSATQMGVFSK
ncbi:3' terminal RNA ribose 2'-O-methyltransferase Hen1 [Methylomagnum sp.]